MRKIFIIGFLVFTTISGQPQEYRAELSFGFGSSVPLGAYGSINPKDNQPGYATIGYAVCGSITYRATPLVGIELRTLLNWNDFDVTQKPVTFVGCMPNTITDISAGKYQLMSFLSGPSIHIPINSFDLSFSGLLGMTHMSVPEISYTGIDGGFQTISTQLAATEFSFTYSLGIDLAIPIFDNLKLKTGFDYLYSNPEFAIVDVKDKTQHLRKQTQRMTLLSLTAGLGYNFWHY